MKADILIIAIITIAIVYMIDKYFTNNKLVRCTNLFDATLSGDELLEYAKELATMEQSVYKKYSIKGLYRKTKERFCNIDDIHQFISSLDDDKIMPSGEWLLDNYYLIEKAIQDVYEFSNSMPRIYLPVITNGEYTGYPRICGVLSRMISHSQGVLEQDNIIQFLDEYQTMKPFTSNEILILPTILQLVIMEVIGELCENIKKDVLAEEKADKIYTLLADCMSSEEIKKTIKEQLYHKEQLQESILGKLIIKLRRYDKSMVLVNEILDEFLYTHGLYEENLISMEHQKQSLNQIYMGNCITSLNGIITMDYDYLYSKISYVERILSLDEIYARMDKESKQYYRNIINDISTKHKKSEIEISRIAIDLAKKGDDEKKKHIGYYLISRGKNELYNMLNIRHDFVCLGKTREIVYITTIILCILLIDGIWVGYLKPQFPILLFLLALIPISEIVVRFFNIILLRNMPIRHIPKLEIKKNVPNDCACLVVIPTLLTSENSVNQILENLEKFYISNKDDNIHFAVLGDFKDSDLEHEPSDSIILTKMRDGIYRLNKEYAKENANFIYFQRNRVFYEKENKWLGYERKRGAIQELVGYLRGDNNGIRCIIKGNDMIDVQYIITLDSDTQLHFGVAKKLLGAMMHPLNKPIIDKKKNIVIDGYAIMQPRIDISLESANKSIFSMIFAGDGGLDPYSSATSDLYHDVFGVGIFTGKGIFDVDAYYTVLQNRFPDSAVLSHDLLEGLYLRNGFVGDVEFTDGFPSKYQAHMKRLHRWVRGDWQLLLWLKSKVPTHNGEEKNPFSPIDKWKLIDNLRRSLYPVSLFILFLLGAYIVPYHALAVFLLGIISLGFGTIHTLIDEIIGGFNKQAYYIKGIYKCCGMRSLYEWSFLLGFLPYQAYKMCDAIIRTIWRVFVSHTKRLEWVTSADSERQISADWEEWICNWIGSIIAIIGGFFIHSILYILGVIWFISPILNIWISKEYKKADYVLSNQDKNYIRQNARRIWAYYEDYAGEEENYLPADNVQIEPPNWIAHRTSPTNIGILMVMYFCAWDFGYISKNDLINRITNTLDTISKLDKWKGHLYNWYDTQTLKVMNPRYISTVDNGNYIGYLITALEGLKELKTEPILRNDYIYGLRDTAILSGISSKGLEELINNPNQNEWKTVLERLLEQEFNPKNKWHMKLRHMILSILEEFSIDKDEQGRKIEDCIENIQDIIETTDFSHLYNEKRKLFYIGFDVDGNGFTNNYYDLFASEARQMSFVAVAKGDVGHEHWFQTARNLVRYKKNVALISWTGTMFEYLMPALIIKSPKNSLLYCTYQNVVNSHIQYTKPYNIPWGISESAYFAFDIHMNYQYKASGVPQLGFKRGLEKDMIISPYSSMMALLIYPQFAVENMKALDSLGASGEYGLYESVDFTPSHLKQDEEYVIVKTYMGHHLGMGLLAMNNVVNGGKIHERFHKNPYVKSAEYLLDERLPQKVHFRKLPTIKESDKKMKNTLHICTRTEQNPNPFLPMSHILSNGNYHVIINSLGASYSTCKGIDISRRIQNADDLSNLIYIRDLDKNEWYHHGYQEDTDFKATFNYGKVEFEKKIGTIKITTTIYVAPDDCVEIRKVTIYNMGENEKTLELTSYQEPVLDVGKSYEAHPSFSKLFVRTEYEEKYKTLIACRRPREEGGIENLSMHMAVSENGNNIAEYETDRLRFLGRNRTTKNPQALSDSHILSNTTGAVVDPVLSSRVNVKISGGSNETVFFVSGFAQNTHDILSLCGKYSSFNTLQSVLENTEKRALIEQKYLNLDKGEEDDILSILPHLLYESSTKEDYQNIYSGNKIGQSGLWALGISGDLPIVLFEISRIEDTHTLRRALKLHEYCRLKGYNFDLVVVCKENASYSNPLFARLKEEISISHARGLVGSFGGVFLLSGQSLKQQEYELLVKTARVILNASYPNLNDSIKTDLEIEKPTSKPNIYRIDKNESIPIGELMCFNGLGGFSDHEYIIRLKNKETTPLAWINVVANKEFGFLASESGGGYTWRGNSRENKLTTWQNDAVIDYPSESLYLRDDDSGYVWGITPQPLIDENEYIIKHGLGYTTYLHNKNGIVGEQTMFVPVSETVKIIMVTLRNTTGHTRNISSVYYMKPIFGVSSEQSRYIKTQFDGVFTLENLYQEEYANEIGFLTSSEAITEYTSDDREFYKNEFGVPNCMVINKLKGKTGTGYPMCGAIKNEYTLSAGETKELVYLFGQAENPDDIIQKFSTPKQAKDELLKVKKYWRSMVCGIECKTPDYTMDCMVNGRLLYQTIACRLFARSACYQSGGAYGFRDQLQDSLATLYHSPWITRERIIEHANHQFIEGDVQHWWHKSSNPERGDKGIRTKFSDDLLWLAYVTAEYLSVTEDVSILDENVEYLKGETLDENIDEKYFIPQWSGVFESVYLHCVRAIDRSLSVGSHGLSLMGSGDWNDGMNTVGNKGKGESVWLSWFLCDILKKFIPICKGRNDINRSEKYQKALENLSKNIDENAWDGNWYLRAFCDDGTPLGSAENVECRIDSISQSWSVLSGVGDTQKSIRALESAKDYLINEEIGIINLLTPPFDKSDLSPGYIKSYLSGTRENGGQYTHASIWLVMAFARLGMGDKASKYFAMINPINHTRTDTEVMRYKGEPYAVAADVYFNSNQMGRAGWTWYTGASGWFYRTAVEEILGLKKRGNRLIINPCVSSDWNEFSVKYQFLTSEYRLKFENPDKKQNGVSFIEIDGKRICNNEISLINDGKVHRVRVVM